ncbi:hypothetical protein R4Z09_27050 [Niallia oryzisoli]|uniref:Uncharacterized protein n=1 Tax=Niallia oryzisoli TaxID=1737571 RepID=A0ABZ2CC08_9BACI
MRVLRYVLSACFLLAGLLLFFIEMELGGVVSVVIAFLLFPSSRSGAKKSIATSRSYDSHYYHNDHDRDDDDWDDDDRDDDHDHDHGSYSEGGSDSDSGGSDD